MRRKEDVERIFSVLWLKYAFYFHRLLQRSVMHKAGSREGNRMDSRKRFAVIAAGSRVSYEFSAPGGAAEK